MLSLVEATAAWLFKNQRGRDAQLFPTNPAFASHPQPTIAITSPDCGDSGAQLRTEYTRAGGGKFPELAWKAPPNLGDSVKEWLLVTEDADAPLPTPIAHGIYGGIPATKLSVVATDFETTDESKALLKGGFHYGATMRGEPYIPPRPLMNHGPHRYFYFVVALGEPLDRELLQSKAKREQVAEAINGKVLGWGQWFGSCERVWT